MGRMYGLQHYALEVNHIAVVIIIIIMNIFFSQNG